MNREIRRIVIEVLAGALNKIHPAFAAPIGVSERKDGTGTNINPKE